MATIHGDSHVDLVHNAPSCGDRGNRWPSGEEPIGRDWAARFRVITTSSQSILRALARPPEGQTSTSCSGVATGGSLSQHKYPTSMGGGSNDIPVRACFRGLAARCGTAARVSLAGGRPVPPSRATETIVGSGASPCRTSGGVESPEFPGLVDRPRPLSHLAWGRR